MSLSTISKGYLGATLAGLVVFGVMKWTDSNLFISAVTGLLLQAFITLWYSEDKSVAILHFQSHFFADLEAFKNNLIKHVADSKAEVVATVDEVKQEADNVETKAVEEVKEVKEPFKVE